MANVDCQQSQRNAFGTQLRPKVLIAFPLCSALQPTKGAESESPAGAEAARLESRLSKPSNAARPTAHAFGINQRQPHTLKKIKLKRNFKAKKKLRK